LDISTYSIIYFDIIYFSAVQSLFTDQTPGSSLTCAALSLHCLHEVVGSLLAVQGLQQVENIIIKHEVDQVEGPCVRRRQEELFTNKENSEVI